MKSLVHGALKSHAQTTPKQVCAIVSGCLLAPPPTVDRRQPDATRIAVREASMTLDARLRVLHASVGIDILMGWPHAPGAGEALAAFCRTGAFLDVVMEGASTAALQKTMLVGVGRDGIERKLQVQVIPTGATPGSVVVLVCNAAY
jgi:hypothetical protein